MSYSKLLWLFIIGLFVVYVRAKRLNSAFVMEVLLTWLRMWALIYRSHGGWASHVGRVNFPEDVWVTCLLSAGKLRY